MFLKSIEFLGDRVIKAIAQGFRFAGFVSLILGRLIYPKTYSRVMFQSLLMQMYQSTIAILPLFVFFALALGAVIIGIAILVAINLGITDKIGSILITLTVNEFAPLFTAFFIALRYSLGLITKLMQLNIEKNLIEFSIPKILNGIITTPAMALLFATIMFASGYLICFLYLHLDFYTYKRLIIDAMGYDNIFILFAKSALFGLFTVLIPVFEVHKINEEDGFEIAKFVVKNFGKILTSVFVIETILIFLLY